MWMVLWAAETLIVLGEGKAEAEKLLSWPIGSFEKYFNILVSGEADQSALTKKLAKHYQSLKQNSSFICSGCQNNGN